MERFTPRGMRSTRFIAVYYLSRLPASRNNGSGRKLPLNTLGSVKPCNDASKGEEGGREGGGSRITCVLQPRIPCVIFNRNRVRQLSVLSRRRRLTVTTIVKSMRVTHFYVFPSFLFIADISYTRREYYNLNWLNRIFVLRANIVWNLFYFRSKFVSITVQEQRIKNAR